MNRHACEEKNNIMDKFSSEEDITKKISHTIEEDMESIEEAQGILKTKEKVVPKRKK